MAMRSLLVLYPSHSIGHHVWDSPCTPADPLASLPSCVRLHDGIVIDIGGSRGAGCCYYKERHNAHTIETNNMMITYDHPVVRDGESVRMILDFDNQTILFSVHGEPLPVIHMTIAGVDDQELYVAMGCQHDGAIQLHAS